ncbi:MAG: hypothetical protein R6V77_03360 [Candidatus Cloacimonadaceae bacterium]
MTSDFNISVMESLAETHLVCDSSYPLITNTTLQEEALLYNLDVSAVSELITKFNTLTGKQISSAYDINNLSGGQKVILMILLALHSPAENIVFTNLKVSLDSIRLKDVMTLIESCQAQKREILVR